jgi:hypothetical protein
VCVVSGGVCVCLSGGGVCVCESGVCVRGRAGVCERGYVCCGGGGACVCVCVCLCVGSRVVCACVFVWTCIGVAANNLNEFLFATQPTPPQLPPPQTIVLHFKFYSFFASVTLLG